MPLQIKLPERPKNEVYDFLRTVEVYGMRKILCFGCQYLKLYDKNKKEYLINHRTQPIDEVRDVVEEIKKVNEGD